MTNFGKVNNKIWAHKVGVTKFIPYCTLQITKEIYGMLPTLKVAQKLYTMLGEIKNNRLLNLERLMTFRDAMQANSKI